MRTQSMNAPSQDQPQMRACPSPETLKRYLLGQLHGPAADAIDEHFADCGRCLARAEDSQADDVLTQCIRSATPIPPEQETAISGVLETIRMLPRAAVDLDIEPFKSIPLAAPTPALSLDETVCGIDSPERQHLELPFVLGHYELQEHIGTGGMGTVYRAIDMRLRRQVAVKVLHTPDLRPREFRQRLLREAQAAAAIEHPNVATVLDVGEVDGAPFLAMPLLRGETLRSRLERAGALPTVEVLRVGQEVAAGLQAAHEAGMVHRDLKPENIWLVERTGQVKILDFGLVRSIEEDSELTHEGVVVGTPLYMAPEQALAGKIDARTDLFGLGGVLYRAATGKPAFVGKNALHTAVAVLTSDPIPAAEVNPEVQEDLSNLIARLLEKDPNSRFQTAGDLSISLAKLQRTPVRKSPSPITPLRVMLAAAALVVMLGIVIIIKNKDGTETRIELPDSGVESIVIDDNGVKKTFKPTRRGQFKSDREAAAWILDNGGALWARSGDSGRSLSVTDKAKLAKTTHITRVELSGDTGFTGNALSQLQGLSHLETLYIAKMPVSESTVKHLQTLPKLRELHLAYLQLDGPSVKPLLGIKSLRILHLYRSETDPAVMDQISKISQLEQLGLTYYCEDEHLKRLTSLANLTTLSIDSAKVTDAGIRTVTRHPVLQSITLRSGQRLTDESMRSLADCPNLRVINLKGPTISDAGVAHLEKLSHLRSLSLQFSKTTAQCVASLRKHKSLSTLGLRGLNIDDAFIEQVATLPALLHFDARSDKITDAGLSSLSGTKLERLTIESKSLTAPAIKQFLEAHPDRKAWLNGSS